MKSYCNSNVESVIAELSGEVIKKKTTTKKLEVYCEDVVARHFSSKPSFSTNAFNSTLPP